MVLERGAEGNVGGAGGAGRGQGQGTDQARQGNQA